MPVTKFGICLSVFKLQGSWGLLFLEGLFSRSFGSLKKGNAQGLPDVPIKTIVKRKLLWGCLKCGSCLNLL